jgi:hypothetical protein
MTSQQQADHLLHIWQQHRALPPDERIERLMADFFSPLPPCPTEYEATLNQVREIMA